jgi:hypothetical protein
MTNLKSLGAVAACVSCLAVGPVPALAGSETGNVLVRVQGTVLDPDSSANVFAGGAAVAGADAEVDTEVLPTLTLTYFLNKNLAVELFCCFAKLEAEGKGIINGVDLGDFWVFPPLLRCNITSTASVRSSRTSARAFITFTSSERAMPTMLRRWAAARSSSTMRLG